MGKRYYCEFCDKQFGDNPSSRRNHLTGVYHQRMRKLYYDSFKEPEVILAEVERGVCRSFQTTGECKFGDRCHYSHITNEYRAYLQRQVQLKKEAEIAEKKRKLEFNPTLEEWLAKREKKKSENPLHRVTSGSESKQQYNLPECLLNVKDIPPSLLPPPPDVFKKFKFLEWG